MAEEGSRRWENSSADALVRASVSLEVMSQPRNPQAEQWSCLSSNYGLIGDREASILEQRARGAPLALPCTAPLSLLFRSPLLVSLNNLLGLLFPPNPSLHPPLPPSLVFFFSVGKFLEEVMGSEGCGEGPLDDRRSMAMPDKGNKHAN